MTNTLHRFGPKEDFQDDYILFAMCTRGKNDLGAPEKLRKFLEICARHHPVNMGDGKEGGVHRPSKNLNPMVHWRREDDGAYEKVIEGVTEPTTVNPPDGSGLTKPSICSLDRASRTGVRLAPRDWAISSSFSRSPGRRSPSRIALLSEA